MSSTTTPTRITLSSSTKISLHERFTKLAKTAKTVVNKEQPIKRVGAGAPLKSSARNRQLALQMGNRPTVRAALKIKNRTLKQRLGGMRNVNNKQGNANTVFKKRLFNPTRNLNQRLGAKPAPANRLAGRVRIIRPRNQLQQRLGNMNGAVIRNNNNTINKNNFRNNFKTRLTNNFSNRLNKNRMNNNQQGYVINRVNNNGGFKKRLRFNRNLKGRLQNAGVRNNFRRRNNGKQQNNNKNGQPQQQQQQQLNGVKSRENLDMDLDNYMKQTKSHLDADLDSYMAQSTSANAM